MNVAVLGNTSNMALNNSIILFASQFAEILAGTNFECGIAPFFPADIIGFILWLFFGEQSCPDRHRYQRHRRHGHGNCCHRQYQIELQGGSGNCRSLAPSFEIRVKLYAKAIAFDLLYRIRLVYKENRLCEYIQSG
jgi:hypothetical protein